MEACQFHLAQVPHDIQGLDIKVINLDKIRTVKTMLYKFVYGQHCYTK